MVGPLVSDVHEEFDVWLMRSDRPKTFYASTSDGYYMSEDRLRDKRDLHMRQIN